MDLKISQKEEIAMRLAHYFITEEEYHPIVVNGVKNEIWLENLNAPYSIIRINSNYIHNNEQLNFDSYKIKNVTKQIKKKTFSFNLNVLNILVDLNDELNIKGEKKIDTYNIKNLQDIRNGNGLSELYPKLKTFTLSKDTRVNLIINITNDINEKAQKENIKYENVFKPKKIIVTRVLMIINIIMFIISIMFPEVFNVFVLDPDLVSKGEYWRLITAAFLHADIIHLLVNMYALNIIGTQVETVLGKSRFLIIYFASAIGGSLMSSILTKGLSVGASGALFGLLGALVYFGYYYRIYFGSVLTSQILPVIILNLAMGFLIPGIDNAGHIGGLISGLFIAMSLGIGKEEEKTSRVNGTIITLIYFMFLLYILLYK